MLATQLNPLVEEEQLSSNCICQINRFIVNTLKDGRYVVFFFVLGGFLWFYCVVEWGLIFPQRNLLDAKIHLGIKNNELSAKSSQLLRFELG